MLDEIAKRYRTIVTVEDGTLAGGLYGAVCEYLASRRTNIRIEGIGIPDEFVQKARQSEQREEYGLCAAGIEKSLRKVFGE